MSFKKKQHWYRTGRSTHHHTNKPKNKKTNAPNTTRHQLQSHGREDQSKPPTPAPSSPTLCHAKAQLAAGTNNPQSPSIMGLSSTSCTNPAVDPSDPKKLQHTLHHSTRDAHWSWPLCVGASPHPPPLSLPKTQVTNAANRASPPPPPSRRNTAALSSATQVFQNPWALSTPTATRTNALPATPPANSTTTSDGAPDTTPSRRVRRQGADVARPEGRGFHPVSPPQRDRSASPWCPQQGEQRSKNAAIMSTDTGEGFCPTALRPPPACEKGGCQFGLENHLRGQRQQQNVKARFLWGNDATTQLCPQPPICSSVHTT
jgi:hypothetical protein